MIKRIINCIEIKRLKLKKVIIGAGKIIIISMSKITKIKQSLKKCKLKGFRTKEKGSNPHSNAVILFKLQSDLKFTRKLRRASRKPNKIKIINKKINKNFFH